MLRSFNILRFILSTQVVIQVNCFSTRLGGVGGVIDVSSALRQFITTSCQYPHYYNYYKSIFNSVFDQSQPQTSMGQEESKPIDESTPPRTLEKRDVASVAKYINEGRAKRIVVMVCLLVLDPTTRWK